MKKLLRMNTSLENENFEKIDQERILTGEPSERLNNAFTNEKENFFCGVWESTTGKWTLNYTEDEFCYMLEGKAILTDESGQTEIFIKGDSFVIPAGFKGSWETIGNAKKLYSIYEES